MATTKMTKKDMFNEIINLMNGESSAVTNEEIVKFCTHEIELLNKKSSSSSGKPTKTQVENEKYKEYILATLTEVVRAMTISEIMENCEGIAGLKNQRVSAIVRQLIESGHVVREEIKRKAYFSAVEGGENA